MTRRPWVLLLPLGARSRPLAMFLMSLCLVSGVPALLGIPPSDSVQALLPEWFIRIWGLCLLTGAGAFFKATFREANVSLEKYALRVLSIASVFYAIVVILAIPTSFLAWWAALITLWFAFWCEARVGVIKLLLKPWEPPEQFKGG